MSKGLILLALGSIIAATLSFIKLSQYRQERRRNNKDKQKQLQKQNKNSKSTKKQKKQKQTQQIKIDDISLNLNINQNDQARQFYTNQISQPNTFKLTLIEPILNPRIQKITYNIILSLNKSKSYDGVNKIKINSNPNNQLNQQDLTLAFVGNLLYLAINGTRIQQKEIQFKQHQINIRKEWLKEKINQIQIIFNNKYAFMGDGLCCYFPMDQNNKYSLKGQVIYSRNSAYKVMKIFPCLNILNNCQVLLQVLHPNGFNAQTNSHKMMTKIVSKKNYAYYPFLFQINNNGLNTSRSRRLNNSGNANNNFKSDDEIVKVRSQFSLNKLSSIHDFFIFCSAVVQVRPYKSLGLRRNLSSSQLSKSTVMKEVLIRYFAKQNCLKKATSFISILQSQIVQIFQKIQQYRKTNKIFNKLTGKIDLFFIDHLQAEGNFNQGSILLSQKSIQRGIIDRHLLFILSRAIVGMHTLSKKTKHLISLTQYFQLNQLVIDIFPQCADFIYLKNKQYQSIQKQCIEMLKCKEQNAKPKSDKQNLSFWMLEYYEKQFRYLVRNIDQLQKIVTQNVRNLVGNLQILDKEQYWTYLIARYPFIQFNVSQVLIKIAIRHKGIPQSSLSLKYLKQNLIKSKYYLKFFTIKQIQKDLKKLIELKSYNIQKYLPFIRIKQTYATLINQQNLQNYLCVAENVNDCIKLYEQFKKFNEDHNYHHISALKRQVKRIKIFLRGNDIYKKQTEYGRQQKANIKRQERDIQCGLQGWKLLTKLLIFSADTETRNLVQKLENIKHKQQYQQNPNPKLIRIMSNPQKNITKYIQNLQKQSENEEQNNQQQKEIQEEVRQIERLLQYENIDDK